MINLDLMAEYLYAKYTRDIWAHGWITLNLGLYAFGFSKEDNFIEVSVFDIVNGKIDIESERFLNIIPI